MKIIIEGNPGEGKTTVVCMLLDAFNAAGFDVELVTDDHEIPFSDPKVIEKRIVGLAQEPHKLSIKIETRVTPRSRR